MKKRNITFKTLLVLISLVSFTIHADATDWLTGAGTQPNYVLKDGKKVKNTNTKPHLWGFIQTGYQQNYGDIFLKNGINKTPFSMVTPNLNSQAGFEINRARIALRGMIDKKNTINYFFMLEFGEDGVTKPAGHSVGNYLTDASITYRGIPYANIRVGQFKYPGSEEGLRAVFASNYRNFSTAGSQLLLERFLPNNAVDKDTNGFYLATPQVSVGAYRDRGVELFNTVSFSKKIHFTYAAMIGSGTGLSSTNASGSPTYYGYLATEYMFGKGKAFYLQSLKLYGWYQNGQRKLNNTNYTRQRYGAGISFYKDVFNRGLRLGAEYIHAKGMIYNGAKDMDSNPNNFYWGYQIAAGDQNLANGGYFNIQYYVIPKKVELMARYDWLDRLTNSTKGERVFKTTTVGLSYHFKGVARIDLNYALRGATAPGNAKAQKVLDKTGNLLSIQATIKI